MTDRVEQVQKIMAAAQKSDAERREAKKTIKAVEPTPVRKSGCNFCSHYRKKIVDGIDKVKQMFLEG